MYVALAAVSQSVARACLAQFSLAICCSLYAAAAAHDLAQGPARAFVISSSLSLLLADGRIVLVEALVEPNYPLAARPPTAYTAADGPAAH
jgi:hypothetical protein